MTSRRLIENPRTAIKLHTVIMRHILVSDWSEDDVELSRTAVMTELLVVLTDLILIYYLVRE